MSITQFAMAHDKDPADVIREEVGDLSNIQVFHNLILVGIYKRPEKTKGGIIITQKSADEERFQGVVGLVLKVGPTAFRNDANNDFAGQTVEPGMWCVYRTSDTHKVSVNGVVCRLLEDAHVKMVVDHPDRVL
jgi:co-chaperonin GroES (HSP10)